MATPEVEVLERIFRLSHKFDVLSKILFVQTFIQILNQPFSLRSYNSLIALSQKI